MQFANDFGKVLQEDGTVDLDAYVEAYDYLANLFHLLGTVSCCCDPPKVEVPLYCGVID